MTEEFNLLVKVDTHNLVLKVVNKIWLLHVYMICAVTTKRQVENEWAVQNMQWFLPWWCWTSVCSSQHERLWGSSRPLTRWSLTHWRVTVHHPSWWDSWLKGEFSFSMFSTSWSTYLYIKAKGCNVEITVFFTMYFDTQEYTEPESSRNQSLPCQQTYTISKKSW